jgi:CBS domain-containing protein
VEVREALACAVKDNDRASTVVGRIRALMQKAPTRTDSVDLNEAVREVIELTHGEALKHGIWLQRHGRVGYPGTPHRAVEQVMTHKLVTCSRTATISSVMELMTLAIAEMHAV